MKYCTPPSGQAPEADAFGPPSHDNVRIDEDHVDLPVETFIVEANVNILTSLLFFKKKPAEVMNREAIAGSADYPIFIAVVEKVGVDRRGNRLYRRSPEGEEITWVVERAETITVGGGKVARAIRRKERIVDDDLPEIAKRYRAFRREHPEPGA